MMELFPQVCGPPRRRCHPSWQPLLCRVSCGAGDLWTGSETSTMRSSRGNVAFNQERDPETALLETRRFPVGIAQPHISCVRLATVLFHTTLETPQIVLPQAR